MKKDKMMIVWVLIVIAVIAILVFITINKKRDSLPEENKLGTEQNINMQNTPNTIEGVAITILKEGTGEVAKNGDIVAMNYTGILEDGTAFDSNVDPKFKHVEPFVFTIGGGQVIKGWDLGVAGMKVGEQRKLVLNPEFAYGTTGAGGVIPPNATLTFEVELMGIKK